MYVCVRVYVCISAGISSSSVNTENTIWNGLCKGKKEVTLEVVFYCFICYHCNFIIQGRKGERLIVAESLED